MKILIETIPHDQQRYDTVGDWRYDEDAFVRGEYLHITVSEQQHWTHEALIAIHELVEAVLCIANDVPQEAVDRWDFDHAVMIEPGDLPDCPYRREHGYAEVVERMLAAFLGVNWLEYQGTLEHPHNTPLQANEVWTE